MSNSFIRFTEDTVLLYIRKGGLTNAKKAQKIC